MWIAKAAGHEKFQTSCESRSRWSRWNRCASHSPSPGLARIDQKTLVESAIKKLRRVLGITDKIEVEPTVSPGFGTFSEQSSKKSATYAKNW
jgi:hypothetical protein